MNRSNFLRLFLVLVVLLSSIFITNKNIFSANWVFLGQVAPDKTDFYYDKASITVLSSDIKKVWLKFVFPIKKIIEERKNFGFPLTGFSSYSHSLSLAEIDCKKQKYRGLNLITYSKNGAILESINTEGSKPESIPPGSMIERLHKAICP